MAKSKSNFLFGTIVLVLTNLITKVIGAIYRIPLLKTLGSEGLGEYQMILPIYALFLVISSSGIVVTMSKFVSRETAVKDERSTKKVLLSGVIIAFASSVVLSLLLVAISGLLVKYQHINSGVASYLVLVPAIIFGSLLSVFRGYFLGRKQMIYSGGAQVVEAGSKLVFSLVLSSKFAQFGFSKAVLGALLGISISEVFALIFSAILYIATRKKHLTKSIHKVKNSKIKCTPCKASSNLSLHSQSRNKKFSFVLKQVFSFSFFITLQSCIMPLVGAIDSIVIVPLLLRSGIIQPVAYSMFGLETGVVSSILALPTVISTAVGSSIIPNIKNKTASASETKNNIKNAFNIVWLTTLFCAFVFMLFAKEITVFLYGTGMSNTMFDELAISSDLLKINSFNIIYLCILSLSISILQGLEKNKTPVINMGIAAIVRFIFLVVLLSFGYINIYGTAIADMAFYVVALILNLREIKKEVNFRFSISKFFVLPIMSCGAVVLSMKLLQGLISEFFSQRVFMLLVLAFGVTLYLIFLSITKVFKFADMVKIFVRKNNVQKR